jgi:hypothetical protein
MKYAWLVIAVFAARFLVVAVAYPAVDGDLAWQRWFGAAVLRTGSIPQSLGPETFTAPGAPWLPHEWLFSIAAALGQSGLAWEIFSGGVALCAILALALAAYRAYRRGAAPIPIALCSGFAGIALFESFGVRAQVVAWPLLAAYLLLLETRGRVAWLAILIAALWSNLHGSAILAPAVALLAAAGAWLDDRSFGPRVRQLFAIAGGSLVAICANPFGWKLPAYALMLMRSPFKANILEWKVTGLEDLSFLWGAFPLLLGGVVFGIYRRSGRTAIRFEDLFVFAAFAWLVLGAARNIAIFALVVLPAVATSLTALVPAFAAAPERGRDWFGRVGLPVVSMVFALVVAILLLRSSDRGSDNMANRPLAALERLPGTHRVLCSNFAWCGLLVGVPRVAVFLDGRADPYPIEVWNDYAEIVRVRPGWRAQLDAHGVDTVVAAHDGPLDQALAAAGGWRVAYSDAAYQLWLRNP